MRSAPPVLVPVGRFVWGGRIALLLALLTLVVGLGWLGQQGAGLRTTMAVLLGWLALAGASAWCWRREVLPAGQLSWDGQAWWFEAHELDEHKGPGPQAVGVRVVWDGQSALALQVQAMDNAGRGLSGLVWLRAAEMPERWHGLRCAVHATDTL